MLSDISFTLQDAGDTRQTSEAEKTAKELRNARKPMKDREPNAFDTPLLPDPGHQAKTEAYIYQQAEMGHFAERPTALPRLLYLWTFTWRTGSNPEGSPVGQVMHGKASMAKAAMSTWVSYDTVRRDYRWLEDNGWIETERGYDDTGREDAKYVFVRMDVTSHRERARTRAMMAEVNSILG